jgi:hypothetical protein
MQCFAGGIADAHKLFDQEADFATGEWELLSARTSPKSKELQAKLLNLYPLPTC